MGISLNGKIQCVVKKIHTHTKLIGKVPLF